MDFRKRAFLQIPMGTERLEHDEALAHRGVVRHMEDTFFSWGYKPIKTAVIDFFDIYRPFLDEKNQTSIYRLIDRNGELLMLRSDITLFLAKMLGTSLTRKQLPFRACYADTILRHEAEENISMDEFFQTGVELIGIDGIDGDLEIIALMLDAVAPLNLPEHYLHIGSRKLFNQCFERFSLDDRKSLEYAIRHRIIEDIERILYDAGWKETPIKKMVSLFSFIGGRVELDTLLKEVALSELPKEIQKELKYLNSVITTLNRTGHAPKIRLDFSEIGSQDYHSGIVFQLYVDGIGSAAGSGGRYDNLLEKFGFRAPAVGFSIFLRKLEQVMTDRSAFIPQQAFDSSSGNFEERYNRQMRNKDKK